MESHDTISELFQLVSFQLGSVKTEDIAKTLEILENIIHTYEPPGTYDEGKYYHYCSALALRTGDAASSEKFLLEAERIVSCAVGPTHPETLLLRRELMHFYQSQGKFQMALEWQ